MLKKSEWQAFKASEEHPCVAPKRCDEMGVLPMAYSVDALRSSRTVLALKLQWCCQVNCAIRCVYGRDANILHLCSGKISLVC